MPHIHPSAVVEPGAQIADSATIGPFCHVTANASVGPETHLISHVSLLGRTSLGKNNTVWPHTCLGGHPQDLKFEGEDSELIIGDHNEIRENVTIHKGTRNDAGTTRIGNHNLLMVGVHIGHDCILEDHLVIANTVQLAGHIHIQSHAAIGGATAIHHFVTVGQYAYIGGMTRVVADVPPYMLLEGNPARIRKINSVLLKRHHFADDQIENLKIAYRMLFRNDGDVGRTAEHLAVLETRYGDDPCIQLLVRAIRQSQEGVHGRYRESLRKDNPFTNPVK